VAVGSHVGTHRDDVGAGREVFGPVVHEDDRADVGREVVGEEATVDAACVLAVEGVDQGVEPEADGDLLGVLRATRAPHDERDACITQLAEQLARTGPQGRARQRIDEAAVDVERPDGFAHAE
jgi:hypothetical protein